MEYKTKRIKIALKSMLRFITYGYWINFKQQFLQILFGITGLVFMLLSIIFFIPYCICDILFSIFIAPFRKETDEFDFED